MNDPTAQIVVGDAPDAADESLCGCGGPALIGAQPAHNDPALPAIAYRVGTHALFLESALASLSSATHPALARLGTRDSADFTVALLDAWAAAGDVLTFYQERIANEQYLRTATERFSVLELARLIGYRPRPGVAASAHLAFTLDAARADAAIAPRPLAVPKGSRVQSVPGPGERAQTFETLTAFNAHPQWNVLTPQLTLRRLPVKNDVELFVQGIATGLRPGDGILLVGDERLERDTDNHWDFRRLSAVEPDVEGNRTRLTWQRPLGSDVPRMLPALNPRLFALRQRASLFGHNALHPRLLHSDTRTLFSGEFHGSGTNIGDWIFSIETVGQRPDLQALLELDSVYPSVAERSWLVLSRPEYQELYVVKEVTEFAKSRYAMSGKRTRVLTDTAVNIAGFEQEYRNTAVFTQSEELSLASTPVTGPVYGSSVPLEQRIPTLEADRPVLFRGKRPRLRVLLHGLDFVTGPAAHVDLAKLTELYVLAAPVAVAGRPGFYQWPVRDADGREGTVTASSAQAAVIPARATDESIAELAYVKSCLQPTGGTTLIELTTALVNAFDRGSLEILANVAAASHGESVSEILGSGAAQAARQSFELKQVPLTYVSAAGASGAASTLEVRIDDLTWHEVDNLLGAGAGDRVFVTRQQEDRTVLEFGDGRRGQRLPSGRDNVRALYRKGIGVEGNVRAGQLTTAIKVPPGIRSVTNPLAASGAADPETRDTARRNSPITIKALGRTVSLRDYQDFAMAFAGIDKALATWSWDGFQRRVLLTVAGTDGAPVPEGGTLFRNLIDALADAGQPTTSFEVRPFVPVRFRVHLKIKVHPDYLPERVQAAVTDALHAAFDFAPREFGQAVAESEVIAVVQAVPGVVAADLDALYRTAPPNDDATLHPRLPALGPRRDAANHLLGAEVLVLEPGPITVLGLMS
jgi:hypothetical protein